MNIILDSLKTSVFNIVTTAVVICLTLSSLFSQSPQNVNVGGSTGYQGYGNEYVNSTTNISIPTSVSASQKPSNGYEIAFSWASNNGTAESCNGSNFNTPALRFSVLVNGVTYWYAQSPSNQGGGSNINYTQNGASFVSGSGYWQMTCGRIANTPNRFATIRLPNSVTTISSIQLRLNQVNPTGGGADDGILTMTRMVTGGPANSTTAISDNFTTAQNRSVTGSVLLNDVDPQGHTQRVISTSVTSAQGVSVSINQTTGQFTYTPPVGFVGTDNFLYSIRDNGSPQASSSARVFISVYSCGSIDTDGDGVFDLCDVDDDNDGVPDAVENASCPQINKNNVTVSSGISFSSALSLLVNGVNDNIVYSSTNGTNIAGRNYLVFRFPTAVNINAIEIAAHSIGILNPGSQLIVQGSNNGSTWTQLGGTITSGLSTGIISSSPTAENFVFTNSNSYNRYRIRGVSGSTIWWYVQEVYFRQGGCDFDNDGIPNNLDLDSDNDGCSDAFESGATTNGAPNFTFANVTGDLDGLSPVVDPGGDGTADYTSTYASALDSTISTCCTDCDGDGVQDNIDSDENDPCSPVQPKGYTGYNSANAIWAAADCDGDGIINGTEHTDNTDPYDDCSSIGGTPLPTSDCDGDGNPNITDPNPTVASANDDAGNGVFGTTSVIDIMANDDFLPNMGNTLTNTGNGTAVGTITFDSVSGEMSYSPTAIEQGKIVTVIYEVCNGTLCAQATVTITIAPALPPDYTPNYTYLKTIFEVDDEVNFIININELSDKSIIDTLRVFIPNMSGYTILYNNSATSITVGGVSENVDNTVWVRNPRITTGILLMNSTGVTPNGRSRIGFTVVSNTAGSAANISTTIQAGSGGDSNGTNNSAALKISSQNKK